MMRLEKTPLAVPWPERVHAVGAPTVGGSGVARSPGAGIALVASLMPFLTSPTAPPIRPDANVFYALTEEYADYTVQVAEEDRADPSGAVYERVAVWVAERYPVVSA